MRITSDTLQPIAERLRQSVEISHAILKGDHLMELAQKMASACMRALEGGGKLILFGKGGSAADAQYLAAELTGRYLRERRALPVSPL